MNVSGKPILANLRHIGASLRGSGSAKMYAGDEPPLRSELFSSEQMKQHGKTLAGSHKLGPRGIRDRLLARLSKNERILTGACNLLTSAVDANRRIAPAGEWLLDNFYLIEEQIRTAKRHLPKVTAGNCLACWTDRRPDFRACTTSRMKRSRTAMDGWTRKVSPVSWRPTRR